MKYEKAKADLIDFDAMEIFMNYSNGSGTSQQQAAYSQISSKCQGFNGIIDDAGNFTCTNFSHTTVGAGTIINTNGNNYQCIMF